MQPRATFGNAAGATALLLALAGCGLVPPATSTAGPLPVAMGFQSNSSAAAAKAGSETVSGMAVVGGDMTGHTYMTGTSGNGEASGNMMSGDTTSQMMGMMGAGSASGSMMSGASMAQMMGMMSTDSAAGMMADGSKSCTSEMATTMMPQSGTTAGAPAGTTSDQSPAGITDSDGYHSAHHP